MRSGRCVFMVRWWGCGEVVGVRGGRFLGDKKMWLWGIEMWWCLFFCGCGGVGVG